MPSIDLWGTPAVMSSKIEKFSFIITEYCFPLDNRNEACYIQQIIGCPNNFEFLQQFESFGFINNTGCMHLCECVTVIFEWVYLHYVRIVCWIVE